MTKLALYFGCLDYIGHYMHGIPCEGRSIDPPRDLPGFPWGAHLVDSGLLENGKIPDQPDGRVWSTCAKDLPSGGSWHAFYWWDRSIDGRGASNSGFYVLGFELAERDDAFAYACGTWPDVVRRQQFPLVLQPKRTG